MNKTLKILLFIIYLGMVAYVCFDNFDSLPDMSSTFLGIPKDKIVHFIMFFPFPLLAYMVFGRFKTDWKAVLWTAVIFVAGCLLASLTEIVQSTLSYRSAEIADFRADCIALAISSIMVFILNVSRKRK